MRRRRCVHRAFAASLLHNLPHHCFQVACFRVSLQLALGAAALTQNAFDGGQGIAAAQIVDDIVDEIEEFFAEFAHGDFGLFAEIDQIAVDAPARRAPFVFLDQRARIHAVAHVLGVEIMELDDDGLRQGGDGDGVFDSRCYVADSKFEGAEHGVRADVPPDFFRVVDAAQLDEQADVIFVLAPGIEMVGNASARETAEDGGAKRFQACIAAHPEGRAGGEGEKVWQKIAYHVHQVDHRGAVGHGDVDVHAENQEGTGELLQFLDDIFVALAGGDDLVDPVGKGMRAGGCDVEADAFGGADKFAAGAVHVDAELVNVLADFGADFDDRLVHLAFDLFAEVGGGGGHELADVRAELARGGIYDLKFFLDAHREAVAHERSPLVYILRVCEMLSQFAAAGAVEAWAPPRRTSRRGRANSRHCAGCAMRAGSVVSFVRGVEQPGRSSGS